MVGVTLVDLRTHVEALASDEGTYYVVCGRTGDRPIPAAGKRFEGRATAESAARATEQYRTALRRYDPQLPYYDLIVCQETDPAPVNGPSRRGSGESEDRILAEPALDGVGPEPERHRLVEFCHGVAAAVFETLSETGHSAVEAAIMDAYFDLAETLSDPDDLCLCLLESMATELDARLTPGEQADLFTDAATRLAPDEPGDDPVSTTFTRLEDRALIGGYTASPWSVDLDGGTRGVVVHISDYALSPRNGRLPLLPVVFELYRRQPAWRPSSLHVADADDGWTVTFAFGSGSEPDGLASVPISQV
jgi:hypothetical protein